MTSRIILIGIGGASCSGKTTLAKHLVNILPRCTLLHQDDYAPPEDQIPTHPVHNVKDWDAPETAVQWPKMVRDLSALKIGKLLPEDMPEGSHEHLSLLTSLPIPQAVTQTWKDRFVTRLAVQHSEPRFVLVDGFLMFYNPDIYSLLDVRILIRSRKDVLERRRSERNERIADDSFWKDPPDIFPNVVWPAYSAAHAPLFCGGDVEHGQLSGEARKEMLLLEEAAMDMGGMVERSCACILDALPTRGADA